MPDYKILLTMREAARHKHFGLYVVCLRALNGCAMARKELDKHAAAV